MSSTKDTYSIIPADKPSAIAKKRLLNDFVKRAKPLPIPVLNPANVAKATLDIYYLIP